MDLTRIKLAYINKQNECKCAILTWLKNNEDIIIEHISTSKTKWINIHTDIYCRDYPVLNNNNFFNNAKLEKEISDELGFNITLTNNSIGQIIIVINF